MIRSSRRAPQPTDAPPTVISRHSKLNRKSGYHLPHEPVRHQPPSVGVRRNRIDRLLAMVLDNTEDFVEARATDYGTRSKAAALFAEILGMISVIEHTRSNVPRWMRSTKLMRAARLAGVQAEVQPSPLGVIGIIGPWNFPVQLTVLPASAAFAAATG